MDLSADRILAALAEQLRREHDVKLCDEDDFADIADRPPAEALSRSRQLLTRRASDFHAAAADIGERARTIRELEHIIQYTELGWPARRDELVELFASDPPRGVAEWTNDVFVTMVQSRGAALERVMALASELPAEVEGVGEIVGTLHQLFLSLTENRVEDAAPMLAQASEGYEFAGRTIPDPAIRLEIDVYLARLALSTDPPHLDIAEDAIQRAGARSVSPIVDALQARADFLAPDRPTIASDPASWSGSTLEEARAYITMLPPDDEYSVGLDGSNLGLDPAIAAGRGAAAGLALLEDMESAIWSLLGPLPAELPLAVAERALAEGVPQIAARACEMALTLASRDFVTARAHEVAAEACAGDETSAKIDHLAQAGWMWHKAGAYQRSREQYEKVLVLGGDTVDVRCRLADEIRLTAYPLNGPDARRRLDQAVEHYDLVRNSTEVTGALSWIFVSETLTWTRLAELEPDRKKEYLSRAIAAACRAVALEPRDASRWIGLADVAFEIEVYELEELAAAHAVELDPSDDNTWEYLRALGNSGDLEAVLSFLGERDEIGDVKPADCWLRGYALLYTGRPDEAVEEFRRSPPELDVWWAESTFIDALLAAGRGSEAVGEVHRFETALMSRRDEVGAMKKLAFTAVVRGDLRQARSFAGEVARRGFADDIGETLAYLALVEGDAAAAREHLLASARAVDSRRAVLYLENVSSRVLNALLGPGQLPADGLDFMGEVVERATAEVRERKGPGDIVDLVAEEMDVGGETSLPLLDALVAVAQNDPDAVAATVRRIRDLGGLEAEADALSAALDTPDRSGEF